MCCLAAVVLYPTRSGVAGEAFSVFDLIPCIKAARTRTFDFGIFIFIVPICVPSASSSSKGDGN